MSLVNLFSAEGQIALIFPKRVVAAGSNCVPLSLLDEGAWMRGRQLHAIGYSFNLIYKKSLWSGNGGTD